MAPSRRRHQARRASTAIDGGSGTMRVITSMLPRPAPPTDGRATAHAVEKAGLDRAALTLGCAR
jgi:hypothetical protein